MTMWLICLYVKKIIASLCAASALLHQKAAGKGRAATSPWYTSINLVLQEIHTKTALVYLWNGVEQWWLLEGYVHTAGRSGPNPFPFICPLVTRIWFILWPCEEHKSVFFFFFFVTCYQTSPSWTWDVTNQCRSRVGIIKEANMQMKKLGSAKNADMCNIHVYLCKQCVMSVLLFTWVTLEP